MEKITNYLKATKLEMANVVWPKRNMVFVHTIIVVVIALFVGYLSGFLDSLFKMGLGKLLGF